MKIIGSEQSKYCIMPYQLNKRKITSYYDIHIIPTVSVTSSLLAVYLMLKPIFLGNI